MYRLSRGALIGRRFELALHTTETVHSAPETTIETHMRHWLTIVLLPIFLSLATTSSWASSSAALADPSILSFQECLRSPALTIDQCVDAKIAPVSNKIASIIFSEIPLDEDFGIRWIVVWLALGALFFTVYLGFINIRGFKHALQLVRGKYEDPLHPGEVSHFQALTAALSGTVGLGNIAGVAVAISVGGPGATFWMIIAGFLGMSSKFAECTLGVKYRIARSPGIAGTKDLRKQITVFVRCFPLGAFDNQDSAGVRRDGRGVWCVAPAPQTAPFSAPSAPEMPPLSGADRPMKNGSHPKEANET